MAFDFNQGQVVDQTQKFKTGNFDFSKGTPDQQNISGNDMLQAVGKSSLNPVRDLTAGAVGALLRLTPSFRGADQAAQQEQKVGRLAQSRGITPNQPAPTTQDILSQAGASPTGKQIAGSAVATGSMFIPGAKLIPALASGFSYGYGTALQSNASQGEAVKSGALTALFNYGFGLLGKGAKGLFNVATKDLPESMFRSTFKETMDSTLARAGAEAKGGTGGKTLARKALEEGITPGGNKELVQTIKILNQTEQQLRTAVSGKGKFVDIGNRQPYISFLEEVKNQYGGGFMSERADKAGQFINALKASRLAGGKGSIPAETALDLKRFIDGMRNTSSFRLDPSLAPKQEQYKAGADALRRALRTQMPEAAKLLDKEQTYIQFKDAIAKDFTKQGNAQAFTLFDAILAGEGPGGLTADAVIKTLQQPSIKGGIAKRLFQAGQIPEKIGEAFPKTTNAISTVARPVSRLLKTGAAGATEQTLYPPQQ